MHRALFLLLALALLLAAGWWMLADSSVELRGARPGPNAGVAPREKPAHLEPADAGAVAKELESSQRTAAIAEPEVPKSRDPELAHPAAPAETKAPKFLLRARVLDHGNPAANRLLELSLWTVGPGDRTGQLGRSERSDEHGLVEFELFERYSELWAARFHDHDSGGRAWSKANHRLEGDVVDVGDVDLIFQRELHPEPLIAGWVLDDAQRPIRALSGTAEVFSSAAENSEQEGSASLHDPRQDWTGQLLLEPSGAFFVHGSPQVESVLLRFQAPDHDSHIEVLYDLPALDYQIRVPIAVRWSGTLLVPEPGPALEDYGVWMSDDRSATGLFVAPDGNFVAEGSTRTTRFYVTQPMLGLRLIELEVAPLALAPGESGDLGEIDLRGRVRVLDVQLIDADGNPAANLDLVYRLDGNERRYGEGIATDAAGRLLLALPLDSKTLVLSSSDEQVRHEIDLDQAPLQLTWP